MVEISFQEGTVVFEVLASHKIWALKSRLEIPLSHVVGAHVEPKPPLGWFDSIKMLGTDVPHLFRAGTFFTHEGRVFFDVRHPDRTIVVDLTDEQYRQLVIEVEDPSMAVEKLQAVVESGRP